MHLKKKIYILNAFHIYIFFTTVAIHGLSADESACTDFKKGKSDVVNINAW